MARLEVVLALAPGLVLTRVRKRELVSLNRRMFVVLLKGSAVLDEEQGVATR